MKKTLSSMRLLAVIVFLLLLFVGNRSHAQPGQHYVTPQGVLDSVFDYSGNRYSLGELAINDTVRGAFKGSFHALMPATCGSGYFQMYLDEGSGFEGTSAANVARLNVLCQVLTDISAMINSPLTVSGNKVNIWIRRMNDVAGGPFAAVATSFNSVPTSPTVSGIVDNAVWLTINSGIDAYTNVSSPLLTAGGVAFGSGGTYFHGMAAFDTLLPWNTDLARAPGIDSLDLYTVALHEFCHALGFATLIDFNGTSRLGTGYNYYSRYDRHLQTSGSIPLLTQTGACGVYNWEFNPALAPATGVLSPGGVGVCPAGFEVGGVTANSTPCATAVKYVDGIITDQPVYTSACYERGSSLSHFEDECYVPASFPLVPPASADRYFVMSNAVLPGVMKRFLKPEERQVLCDIGYHVGVDYGDVSTLNDCHYAGGDCPGISVVGINDGISPGGAYTYFTTALTPVAINGGLLGSILTNDHGAVSFRCLEVVLGAGTLSATTGTAGTLVNYTPAAGTYGLQLLRYIPCDAAGVEGNITYIYVYIGDASCVPSACDLVSNGDMEGAIAGVSGDIANYPDYIHCWYAFQGSADLFSRFSVTGGIPITSTIPATDVHPLSAAPNDHFLAIYGSHNDLIPGGIATFGESMQTVLSSGMVPGNNYVISFWAKMANSPPNTLVPENHVQFCVDTSLTPYASTDFAHNLTPGFTELFDFIVPGDNQWHYMTQTIAYPLGSHTGNLLNIINAMYNNPLGPAYPTDQYYNYLYIDDISIKPTTTACILSIPSPLCFNNGIINLPSHTTCPGGTFSWLSDVGAGPVISLDPDFDPGAAYNASVGADGIAISHVAYEYTDGLGCVQHSFQEIDILPLPAPVSGDAVVCVGSTITLHDISPAGTWSSANDAIATVITATGIVSGVGVGITTISYTTAAGCFATYQVTVTAASAPILGALALCTGATTTLTDATAGGTWSSSDPAFATIDIATGILTAGVPGTSLISYTLAVGCASTAVVTVSPIPVITGTATICAGLSTSFTALPTGGTWSSGATGVATVDASGTVTGVIPGTAAIYYTTAAGCIDSAIITVDLSPGPITGTLEICALLATPLSDVTPGGTWSSSDISVAVIFVSGLVTGLDAGTSTISYVLGSGCFSTAILTVNAASVITGAETVCTGLSTPFTATPAGGTWSSGATGVATVDASGTVTGVIPGTAAIYYTTAAGCMNSVIVTVNPSPAPITGSAPICVNGAVFLSNDSTGGTWSADAPADVDMDGIVYGDEAGTFVITYTLPGGCFATTTVLVNPRPDNIAGPDHVCLGQTITLSDATPGGTWINDDPLIATVSATGVVTGNSPGLAVIRYTLATGCYTAIKVRVDKLPEAIAGLLRICVTETTSLKCSPSDGTWSSSDGSIATVFDPATGKIYGASGGTATITYTVTGTGCYATAIITVVPLPLVAPINCRDSVCVGSMDTLRDDTPGGSWYIDSDDGIAEVVYGPGGWVLVSGLSEGAALIYYTVANECGKTTVTKKITVSAPPHLPAITGAHGVCSDFTSQLANDAEGGVWTSSNPLVASIDPVTGLVTGITAGSVTITYTLTTICGTDHTTFDVLVNMAPYITSNSIVACQTLSGAGGDSPTGPVISGGPCILVCDQSIVRYYANGVGGTYTWNIGGGTVIADYGDSVDVLWTGVGTIGSVTLHDAFEHCIDSASACVKVIAKPNARFVSYESYCLGDNAVFIDLSSGDPASPIVYYHWDYGDGAGSATMGSTEHTYTAAGTYTITLTVKNQCNCSDTYLWVVNVDALSGPDIVCPSIVCDSEYATYSTTSVCSYYNWDIVGGTIVSGAGTNTIVVHWDMVDSSGFGYISLSTPDCTGCSAPSLIKIPVIQQSPLIAGPDVICAGQQYEYKLPLWPATSYMWGVLTAPGVVVDCHEDYKAVLSFPVAGTYTVHAWYQNKIKLCGANAYKVITVLPPVSITGPAEVCAGVTNTFTNTGGLPALWSFQSDATGIIIHVAGGGAFFIHAFAEPGVYHVSAVGAFCADPFTVTVRPVPPPVDSVAGADTICLNRVYTYKCYYDVPGAVYSWQAIGGNVSPSSGTNVVTVVWTDPYPAPKELRVWREGTAAPYCPGPTLVKTITQELVNPHVTGDTTPCANAFRDYKCHYRKGEDYSWLITPSTAGSVTLGGHDSDITVLWNNTDTIVPATLVVLVSKCDTVITDTLHLRVFPGPQVSITSVYPDTVCPGQLVTFVAMGGADYYSWPWSGTPVHDSIATHAFYNDTTVDVVRHIGVRIRSNNSDCPYAGTASVDVVVKPGPSVVVSTPYPFVCYPGPGVLIADPNTPLTGLTYSWSGVPGDASYTTFTEGWYYCVVSAPNGCSDTSIAAGVSFSVCGDTLGMPCTTPFPFTYTQDCNTTTLNMTGATGQWYQGTTPIGTGTSVTVSHDLPGYYTYAFVGTYLGCTKTVYEGVTVYASSAFTWQIACAPDGTDSLFLYAQAYSFAGASISSYTWTDLSTGLPIPTGAHPYVIITPGVPYNIRLTINGTLPDGTPFTCSTNHTITPRPAPTASFTAVASPICERVPIVFTSSVTGLIEKYHWDFGDNSTLILPNSRREYTYSNSAPGFPDFPEVTLTVTDSFGCTATATQIMEIHENSLLGNLGSDQIVCSGGVPVTINWVNVGSTPSSYEWSTGITEFTGSITVNESGNYWVTVHNALQCQKLQPAPVTLKVKIIETPDAEIHGVQHYCIGDVVKLNAYSGKGVDYKWLRGNADIGTFGYHPSLDDDGRPVGIDTYKVVIRVLDTTSGVYCFDTSDRYIVNIYGLPDPPAISGPVVLDCAQYHLQLSASATVSGLFNWSNGTVGAVDDIYAGGPYRVWFTDLHGCVSHSDTSLPLSPSTYFPYFPAGCYSICREQLPLTLYGPPCVPFVSWDWLQNGTDGLGGTYSSMGAYNLTDPGDYQWALNNGLCADSTRIMSVSTVLCNKCQDGMDVSIACDPASPAGYTATIVFTTPTTDVSYILGGDIGPVTPFSGLIATGGSHTLTLTFTTLLLSPVPDSVTIEMVLTYPDGGGKCFMKKRVALPHPCGWVEERGAPTGNTHSISTVPLAVNTAMLVFPNPSSGEVNISYDYGSDGVAGRLISIYDALGRKMQQLAPQDVHGSWKLNTNGWAAGTYIIRMEGNGSALHTQRVVLVRE